MLPRGMQRAARRMMPQIKIAFDTKDFSLRATELQFADGSTMRNDFINPALNPSIDEKKFNPEGSESPVLRLHV